jgi:UDP-N-acetylmuramoyl-L-alanyl-D-glutamate--2,6-diaminopimelate ligase
MDITTIAQIVGGRLEGAAADTPAQVRGVSHNSAWIKPGDAFVALRGRVHDGHDYIPDALARGAVLIVGEGRADTATLPVPYLKVNDARSALADLAATLNDHPSRALTTVGITGTKGKTTTAWLIRHLLRVAGHKTSLLSTLGYKLQDDKLHQFPAHFTTPEAPQLQSTLAEMVKVGCTHAVIEASSEALAQERLRNTQIDVAVWTNLAPEHLNFHGDMEGYFRAKRRLFDAGAFAILNAGDAWGMRLADRPHTTYADPWAADAGSLDADWWASNVTEDGDGLTFTVHHPGGSFPAKLPMIGAYNVANAMGAITAVAHLGVDIAAIQAGLASFAGVPGRMQILGTTPARVILDFAHTPDSLRLALSTLRQTTAQKLIVVLGSAGGPRDPGKRAPLGKVAATLADLAVFTEEDCRDTPIDEILNEMRRGAVEAGQSNYRLIRDRRKAIRYALDHAHPGDTVVFCGKAGETTLERATETLPWIEEDIVREEMTRLGWSTLSGDANSSRSTP